MKRVIWLLLIAACTSSKSITPNATLVAPSSYRLVIAPENHRIQVGDTLRFGVLLVDDKSSISCAATYRSEQPAVASINSVTGLVHGLTNGVTHIIASCWNQQRTTSLSVGPL